MKMKKLVKSSLKIAAMAGVSAVLLLSGCQKEENQETWFVLEGDTEIERATEVSRSAIQTETAGEICVFVCGSVPFPGVYLLPEGARVSEAVEAAGGFGGDADREWLNLARPAVDGEQIRVPSREETAQADNLPEALPEEHGTDPNGEGRINLNLASKEELMELPGIGEAKAESIIAYREEHGGFSAPEEIMEISGIKTAVYERIRDRITVN